MKSFIIAALALLAPLGALAQTPQKSGQIFSGLGAGDAIVINNGDALRVGDTAEVNTQTQQEAQEDLAAIEAEIKYLEAFINNFKPIVVVEYLKVTQQEMLGYGRTGCFLPDTEVTMADGSKRRIADVVEGEEVLSWTADGTSVTGTVLARVETPDKPIMVIDGIHVTPEHKFRLSDGTIKSAQDVAVGDVLAMADGQTHTVASVTKPEGAYHVHNLIVSPNNTFVAAGMQVGGYDPTGIINLTD